MFSGMVSVLVVWPVFVVLKFIFWLLGLVLVPLSFLGDGLERPPRLLWLWGNDEVGFRNEDFGGYGEMLWDRMMRNPVGNSKYFLEWLFGDPQQFEQFGVARMLANHVDGVDPLESDGFLWRWRQKGVLSSFRMTFGRARPEGKREIYIGFKLGSSVPGIGFTFQFRIF